MLCTLPKWSVEMTASSTCIHLLENTLMTKTLIGALGSIELILIVGLLYPCYCVRIMQHCLFFAGNEYQQYDFFVYPKLTSVEKGVIGRAWEGGVGIVKNWFNVQSETATEDGFTPPSTEKMVKKCLHHYLEPFKRVLLVEDGYSLNFKLDEFVRRVKHIFKQHSEPVVQHSHNPCTTVAVDITDVRKECNTE